MARFVLQFWVWCDFQSSTAGVKFCTLSALVSTFKPLKCLCLGMGLNYINCSHHFTCFIRYIPHMYAKIWRQCTVAFSGSSWTNILSGPTVLWVSHSLQLMQPVTKLYSRCIFLVQFQYCVFHTLYTLAKITVDNTTEIICHFWDGYPFNEFSFFTSEFGGHEVAQLVEGLRRKPAGRRFDSRWCQWNLQLT